MVIRKPKRPCLNPNLKQFWKTKADIKVLKGGRASSKTWDTAGFAVFLASNFKVKFLCIRQFQNKISESVYAVIKVQAERFGLAHEFDFQQNKIIHKRTGSEFHFYGIARNFNEIKGFEGANICWIEEGEAVLKEQWDVIKPTVLRNEGAEIWLLYNPRLVDDFVETLTHDPENGIIVRLVNYDENPFLSGTMIREIERFKAEDFDEYQHVYKGVPLKDDDNVIIKRSWIEAAIDAHIKLGIEEGGATTSGFDVADSGKDKNAQILKRGIVAYWGEQWKGGEDELLESCTRVYNRAVLDGADINYDSIGVGASAGGKFKELNELNGNELEYAKFIAGAGVTGPDDLYVDSGDVQITNKEFFENLKAQQWWLLAERFRNTYNAITKGETFETGELISISSEMPDLSILTKELCTPRRKFSGAGKVMVETKDQMKKRHVDSPNYADAFIMAYYQGEANAMLEAMKLMYG